MEKLTKFDDQVSHLFLSHLFSSIREKVNEIVDYINENKNFAASGSDTSRITPNNGENPLNEEQFTTILTEIMDAGITTEDGMIHIKASNLGDIIAKYLIKDNLIASPNLDYKSLVAWLHKTIDSINTNIEKNKLNVNSIDIFVANELFKLARKDFENQSSHKKDNPVPSLDNLAIKIMKIFGTHESHHWVKDSVIEVLKSELQNGRTTDKENLISVHNIRDYIETRL